MRKIFLTLLMILVPLIAQAATYEITTPGNNVGIGSTNPGVALDVNGTVRVTNNGAFVSGSGNGYYITGTNSNVGISASSGYTAGQQLDVNGTVKMVGFQMPTGAVSGYNLQSDGNGNGTWAAASSGSGTVNSGTAGQATFYATSTTAVSGTSDLIFAGNNVGIGSSVPGQILDVKGTDRMTGFNLSTSPTNNYLLTSDASGNGTWKVNPSLWATQNTTDQSLAGGNVGIGTTLTTTAALSVMNGNVGIGTWVPSGVLQINGVGNVGIGSLTPGYIMDVQGTTRFTGDILAHGTGPSCSSCGTCSVVGNDNWFRITVGSTTSCTATFSTAKTQNSGCVCMQEGTATFPTCSVSTTAVTCSTVVTGDAMDCSCGV